MHPLPLRVRFGYAIGGASSGTYGTVPGLILMPFLTDELGVAAGLAGALVFAPKALDFLMNPVAGRISDRARIRDRRRPFILASGVALTIGFVAMFVGPVSPPSIATVWVLLLSLACASAYAFFQVPYLAMSAELTDDYTERTRLMTWRVVVITLAILVAGGGAPALVALADGVDGYRVMAVVMAAIIAIGTAGLLIGTRGAPLARPAPSTEPVREQLRIVVGDPDGRSLVAAFVLQAIAMGMVLAGIVYVARHIAGDPSLATFAFVGFVAPAMIVTPLWGRVARTIGKRRGFAISTLVLVVGLLGLTAAALLGPIPLVVCAGVVGVGYAGGQLFPLSMLPDFAAEDARRSGRDRVGLISGVWSGFELLGYAFGPALFGVVLAFGGYAATTGETTAQPATAQWAILAGVSLIPAVLAAISLIPLSRYRLDDRLRATRSTAG